MTVIAIARIANPIKYAPWSKANTAAITDMVPAAITSVTISIIVSHVALLVLTPLRRSQTTLTTSPPTYIGVVKDTNSDPIRTRIVFHAGSIRPKNFLTK